jgi:hypothetical protein
MGRAGTEAAASWSRFGPAGLREDERIAAGEVTPTGTPSPLGTSGLPPLTGTIKMISH